VVDPTAPPAEAVVLDASAVLAMLLEEPGGDVVAACLPRARISAVIEVVLIVLN
jgi:PIN domain nuclease of toxin-antitoxin system